MPDRFDTRDVDRTREELGVDASLYYAPTSVEEQAVTGYLRTNKPAGEGVPAPTPLRGEQPRS